MKEIITWIIIWFFAWGVFNINLRWNWEKLGSKRYIPRGMYFIFFCVSIYFYYKNILSPYIPALSLGFVISTFIGLVLGFNKNFYNSFSRDRYFLLVQPLNILYQQASAIVLMLLFKKYLGQQYSDIYFGTLFVAIHFPLAFLPWSKLKYYLLAGCFFGGWLFSYLNFNFEYGVTLSFLTHYAIYVWQIYYLKDERKI